MNRREATGRRDPQRVRRFIDRFAATLVDAGMPRMPSLVFAALLSSDDARLTAEELIEQLEVSRAAVSGAVRYLLHVEMIRREREPGSRRDVYALYDDSWFEVVARRDQILKRWIAAASEGVQTLGPRTAAGRRLAQSRDFFEFLDAELPALLARWQQRNSSKSSPRRRGSG